MGDLVEALGVHYAIIRPTLVFGAGREVVPRQRLSLDYTADVNTNMVKPILSIVLMAASEPPQTALRRCNCQPPER